MQNDPFSQPGYTDNFYDAVGGHETFVKLIDVFYDGVATDPLLRPMYPEEDLGAGQAPLPDVPGAVLGRAHDVRRGTRAPAAADAPHAVPGHARRPRSAGCSTCATAVDALELPPLYEGTLWDYMERAALSMVNSASEA